jgi:orotate phosphoribosyltransferase
MTENHKSTIHNVTIFDPHRTKRVADFLIDSGVISFNFERYFTLSSGVRSPIYIDIRGIWSSYQHRTYIVSELSSIVMAWNLGFLGCVGVESGGIAPALLLAERLQCPFLFVRPKAKTHGTKDAIGGLLPDPSIMSVIVEDVVTTGGSLRSAISNYRDSSLTDPRIVALSIFDYQVCDIGGSLGKEHSISYYALTTFDVLLTQMASRSLINQFEKNTLEEWIEWMRNRARFGPE